MRKGWNLKHSESVCASLRNEADISKSAPGIPSPSVLNGGGREHLPSRQSAAQRKLHPANGRALHAHADEGREDRTVDDQGGRQEENHRAGRQWSVLQCEREWQH